MQHSNPHLLITPIVVRIPTPQQAPIAPRAARSSRGASKTAL
jgi:hypothetical protein